MADALEDHEGKVNISGKTITKLRFTDDIAGLAGQEQELVNVVNQLEEVSLAYVMRISAQKTRLMKNNTNDNGTHIAIDKTKLEPASCFKYLGG